MTVDMAAEGGSIILPKRASLGAVLALLLGLLGQLWYASGYIAKVEARFDMLTESDARLSKRGDDRYAGILQRIDTLERGRADESTRLTRVEERLLWQTDTLGRIEKKLDGLGPPRR